MFLQKKMYLRISDIQNRVVGSRKHSLVLCMWVILMTFSFAGITAAEVNFRKQRNAVTMGFNSSVWFLEASTGLALLLIPSQIIRGNIKAGMFIMSSCFMAPLLYILGMSDVRHNIRQFGINLSDKIRRCKCNCGRLNVIHVSDDVIEMSPRARY